MGRSSSPHPTNPVSKRWALLAAAVCGAIGVPQGCQKEPATPAASTSVPNLVTEGTAAVASAAPANLPAVGPAAVAGQLFTEITGSVGLPEKAELYPPGQFKTPEITPGGVALFDYDHDGLLDLLVVPHPTPGPYAQMIKQTNPCRLYHQEKDGRFTEVPNAGGLAGSGFHHGVAIGDFNNDGFPDVFITNYGGGSQLFLNNGDGTFTDVTKKAGIVDDSPQSWSSTAAFADLDGDGFLDLIVVHFATFDPSKICIAAVGQDPDYCGPHQFPGQRLTIYHNKGNGTFQDVTQQLGITATGRGWGVIAAPMTNDDFPDIFQANDEEPNQLWVRQSDGKYVDEAVIRGCAINVNGAVEANMGVTIGDAFNQGVFDIFVTHITSETNTLWHDNGGGNYVDVTAMAGMGAIDRPFTGWGCGFVDYDNDGNLDLAIANGRVAKGPAHPESDVGPFWNYFAEQNLLFRGDGRGHFTDASRAAKAFTGRLEVHRALAFGDLRNRGAMDMVTMNLDNTVRVFRNDAALAGGNHWLQVLPMLGKREALGAKVLLRAGAHKQLGACLRAYSYLSSNDPRIHFGLGEADKVDSIDVVWPSGSPRRERFDVSGVDRVLVVEQGKGKAM
jgi:enediyne biosynthesis protein E4